MAKPGPKKGSWKMKKVSRRDDKGKFLPGVSGNPKGRPPVPYEIRHQIANRTRNLNSVLDFLVGKLTDDEVADNTRYKCAELLLNYSLGKPVQMIDLEQKSIHIHVTSEESGGDTEDGDTITIDDL